MLAKSILVLAGLLATSASQPGSDALMAQRFFLTCIGTMRTAAAPAMPITANGLVDLAGKRVAGFGVGGAPIILLTDTQIGFGGTGRKEGEHVEGLLDRRSGKARIVVVSETDPAHDLITMELDCRPAPSTS